MANGIGRNGATFVPVRYSKRIDLAGSSASDVFVGPTVPANSVIISGGFIVTEAFAGTSTDMALDMGVTGGDVDNFVDGFDFDNSSVGDIGYKVAQTDVVVTTSDTVDVLVQAQTGTCTAGEIEVWVYAVNADATEIPGIAAVGS
jgi:hypothetical protein